MMPNDTTPSKQSFDDLRLVTCDHFALALLEANPLCLHNNYLVLDVCDTIKQLRICEHSTCSDSIGSREIAQLQYFPNLEILEINVSHTRPHQRLLAWGCVLPKLTALRITTNRAWEFVATLPNSLLEFEFKCSVPLANTLLALPILPNHLERLTWCAMGLPVLPASLRYLAVGDDEGGWLMDNTWTKSALPDSLEELHCQYHGLAALPAQLPNGLMHLSCSHNRLTTLPIEQLKGLKILHCGHNQFTELPDHLPDGLQKLDCTYNQLITLPLHLPNGLEVLLCRGNYLTSLPATLPAGLKRLHCGSNQLTALPDCLPEKLEWLNCFNNELSGLPDLLPTHLQELDCTYNQLTRLPVRLPASLVVFRYQENPCVSV